LPEGLELELGPIITYVSYQFLRTDKSKQKQTEKLILTAHNQIRRGICAWKWFL